jgi:hypothetical protein
LNITPETAGPPGNVAHGGEVFKFPPNNSGVGSMRKIIVLVGLVALLASSTGCNCLRQNQGMNSGLFGGTMFGHRQPMVSSYAAPAMFAQQAAVPCCPPVAVECCYDPCQETGMMMGPPVQLHSDGPNCCN